MTILALFGKTSTHPKKEPEQERGGPPCDRGTPSFCATVWKASFGVGGRTKQAPMLLPPPLPPFLGPHSQDFPLQPGLLKGGGVGAPLSMQHSHAHSRASRARSTASQEVSVQQLSRSDLCNSSIPCFTITCPSSSRRALLALPLRQGSQYGRQNRWSHTGH